MKDLYVSGQYVERNPTYHVDDSPWKARQILAMLRKHDLLAGAATVGEIGCGVGEVLRQLQPHFRETTCLAGYEISPQAFELCRPRANEQLQFFCEDLLGTDAAGFDVLLCIDVFEHVEDYMGFLRRLRERGTFKIFHIPLDMSVQGVLRGRPIFQGRAQLGHLHYFSRETALLTLQDTGYEIIDWFYTPSGVERGKSGKARMARWPRKLLASIDQGMAVRILGGYSLLVLAR